MTSYSNQTFQNKFVLIGCAFLILGAVVIGVVIGLGPKQEQEKARISTTNSIKQICNVTKYKETCQNSMIPAVNSATSLRELILESFWEGMNELHKAIDHASLQGHLQEEPFTKKAFESCNELLNYSVTDLEQSFKRLESFDITKIELFVEDLGVWLGGALSLQETCLDNFEEAESHFANNIKKLLRIAREITINSINVVDHITKFLDISNITGISNADITALSNGRLLSAKDDDTERRINKKDGFPTWVDDAKRRIIQEASKTIQPDVVVAKDASGKYRTINEALKDIPIKNPKLFVIHVKEGVYRETVKLTSEMTHVMILGDGPTKTKVRGNLCFANGIHTPDTATFAALGSHFIAKDIGFENTAGPEGKQAVALRVLGDFSIIHNCFIHGYQDTLLAEAHRQFYLDSTITGTIDFIFGDAEAIFQNCQIVVRKPLPGQKCVITAQGRLQPTTPSAIVLHGCKIRAERNQIHANDQEKAYLGRPWKAYSRTIILQSDIDDIIQPEGWLQWNGTNAHLDTCYYAEFGNKGPGANIARRVKWRGIKNIDVNAASDFTPRKYWVNDAWIQESGLGLPYHQDI